MEGNIFCFAYRDTTLSILFRNNKIMFQIDYLKLAKFTIKVTYYGQTENI